MKGILIALGILGVGVLAMNMANKPSVQEMRAYLMTNGNEPWARMSDQEIKDSYILITEYTNKNKQVSDPALIERLKAISNKYRIFT